MTRKLPAQWVASNVAFTVSVGFALAFLAAGCNVTNILNETSTQSKTSLSSGAPQLGTTNDGSAALNLVRVVRSSVNPSGDFDLIGDGQGSFGLYCRSGAGGNGGAAQAGTTCQCVYNYLTTSGDEQEVRVDTTYNEEDLVRCPFGAVIPSDLVTVRVRLYLANADLYSNEYQVRLNSNSTALNTADINSFVRPRRYQCKNIVTIPYDFDNSVYDPIRSEDPDNAITVNFYSSNLGGTLASWVKNGGNFSDWECPSLPNDSSANLDLTVYSLQSDGSSQKIFPANGSRYDRTTFFLAKSPVGIFSVPVNARVAPEVLSNAPLTASNTPPTIPPLGYGARPVPTGPDTEACPSSSTIPTGYHWVKVWNFRTGSIPRRNTLTAPIPLGTTAFVACNPGKWKNTEDGMIPIVDGVKHPEQIRDCGADGGKGLSDPSAIADRIIGPNPPRCVGLTFTGTLTGTNQDDTPFTGGLSRATGLSSPGCHNSFGTGCTTHATGATAGQQKTGYENFMPGSDIWLWPLYGTSTATEKKQHGDPAADCATPGFKDPLNLCSADFSATREKPPHGTADVPAYLDSSSRIDNLLVASPPEVMLKDVKAGNDSAAPYIPFRFRAGNQCLSGNPAAAPVGDCLLDNRIDYEFVQTEITLSSDDQTNGAAIYPICALQPD